MGQALSIETLDQCCNVQSNKGMIVSQSVGDANTIKLKDNTERFLRTMAESGKHDMLIGLKETKSDFDINSKDPNNGETALHKAAKNGHLTSCIVLMESGASTSVTNKQGKTPTELAAANGHTHLVAILDPSREGNISPYRPTSRSSISLGEGSRSPHTGGAGYEAAMMPTLAGEELIGPSSGGPAAEVSSRQNSGGRLPRVLKTQGGR